MTVIERTKKAIRAIPDFPVQGVIFRDITPVLEDPELSRDIVTFFKEELEKLEVDAVIGVESRGFLYGMPLAMELDVPFITVRKKGKLPYKTISHKYDLEYGSAEIEMHTDSLKEGWNVVVHDDLLATGGTAAAAAELAKSQGCKVSAFAFLVELAFLKGKDQVSQYSENIIKLAEY